MGYAKLARQLVQQGQRRTRCTGFDAPHVGAIDVEASGQFGPRPSPLSAKRCNPPPDYHGHGTR